MLKFVFALIGLFACLAIAPLPTLCVIGFVCLWCRYWPVLAIRYLSRKGF